MKRHLVVLLVLLVGLSCASFAKDKKDQQKKGAQIVDSGSFGVFVGGRRIATEKFTIKQMIDMNVTSSEIKILATNQTQTSELQLTPTGDLIKYEWKESGPERGETVLEPSQQFLIQHIKTGDKTVDQPYLMPTSSAVLDDYFFSHRELLLWRYLGSSCRLKAGENACKLEKGQYGFVVPRQRQSGMATLNYIGRDNIELNGKTLALSKFTLSSDFGDWVLWLDENHKLMRVVVMGENTEIIRD